MAKSSFHHKTVSGFNGVNLNTVLMFITGEKSIKYEWDNENSTFLFYVKKKFSENDKGLAMLEHFKKFFRVGIVLV